MLNGTHARDVHESEPGRESKSIWTLHAYCDLPHAQRCTMTSDPITSNAVPPASKKTG
jgi:hypothetical protein